MDRSVTAGRSRALPFSGRGGGQIVLVGLLAALCLGLSIGSAQFYSLENVIAILRQCSLVLIVACGMTLLLIAAEVDLSVGASLAFAGCVAMSVVNATDSVVLGAFAAVLFGGAVGLFNGLVVTRLKVNSLIATIATLMILQGGVFLYTREAVQNRHQILAFTEISTGYVGPIPIPVLMAAIVFVIAYVVLRHTIFGRRIYGVGANEAAATAFGRPPGAAETGRLRGHRTADRPRRAHAGVADERGPAHRRTRIRADRRGGGHSGRQQAFPADAAR